MLIDLSTYAIEVDYEEDPWMLYLRCGDTPEIPSSVQQIVFIGGSQRVVEIPSTRSTVHRPGVVVPGFVDYALHAQSMEIQHGAIEVVAECAMQGQASSEWFRRIIHLYFHMPGDEWTVEISGSDDGNFPSVRVPMRQYAPDVTGPAEAEQHAWRIRLQQQELERQATAVYAGPRRRPTASFDRDANIFDDPRLAKFQPEPVIPPEPTTAYERSLLIEDE